MTLSEFLMVTHLLLFIHGILYTHILYVLHKKLLRLHKKLCCDKNKNKTKKFTQKLLCAPKLGASQKNMLREQQKII